ncbi:MAG: hypothetical protein NTX30_20630, partial [Deltaproteobacteria bacterium]|nr:hypothetical protein [Deltaproteobacteria bacterium]
FFLCKDQNHKSFYENGLLFAFRSFRDEDKRMNEEEAESAEIILRKTFGVFDHPGGAGNGGTFPPASGLKLLAILISACSASSAVKFFLFG